MEQVTVPLVHRPVDGRARVDVTVFTKNWERLLAEDTAVAFQLAITGDSAVKRLCPTSISWSTAR